MVCYVCWFYFIQGPPGTGKSFVGVALVQLLLSMNVPQNHGPILVRYRLAVCTKNVPFVEAQNNQIGPLHDLVTWNRINYAGMQVTHLGLSK